MRKEEIQQAQPQPQTTLRELYAVAWGNRPCGGAVGCSLQCCSLFRGYPVPRRAFFESELLEYACGEDDFGSLTDCDSRGLQLATPPAFLGAFFEVCG